jgi:hypothetical protein
MLWFYIIGMAVGAFWLGGEIYIISNHMPEGIQDWSGFILSYLLFLLGYAGFMCHASV